MLAEVFTQKILPMLTAGRGYGAIGRAICSNEINVSNRVLRLRQRLGLHSNLELALWYVVNYMPREEWLRFCARRIQLVECRPRATLSENELLHHCLSREGRKGEVQEWARHFSVSDRTIWLNFRRIADASGVPNSRIYVLVAYFVQRRSVFVWPE